MDFCSMVDRLYRAVPLRRFRDWLIRAHLEGCPRCQARLLSRDEARSLLVGPEDVGPADALWQRISRLAEPACTVRRPAPRKPGWVWRWAAAAAMTAAVAVTGFWVLRQVERPEAGVLVAEVQRFEIDYVNVGGEPARTFVYQPQGTDTVFVWASRTP
jgi:hypothetical protein